MHWYISIDSPSPNLSVNHVQTAFLYQKWFIRRSAAFSTNLAICLLFLRISISRECVLYSCAIQFTWRLASELQRKNKHTNNARETKSYIYLNHTAQEDDVSEGECVGFCFSSQTWCVRLWQVDCAACYWFLHICVGDAQKLGIFTGNGLLIPCVYFHIACFHFFNWKRALSNMNELSHIIHLWKIRAPFMNI